MEWMEWDQNIPLVDQNVSCRCVLTKECIIKGMSVFCSVVTVDMVKLMVTMLTGTLSTQPLQHNISIYYEDRQVKFSVISFHVTLLPDNPKLQKTTYYSFSKNFTQTSSKYLFTSKFDVTLNLLQSAVSSFSDMAPGTSFHHVLSDPTADPNRYVPIG